MTDLETSVSLSSFPLFITNSIIACIAPSADGLILSHIAAEQPCRVATSCNKTQNEESCSHKSDLVNVQFSKKINDPTSSFVNKREIEDTILLKTSDGSMEASWIYNRRKSKYWDGLTFSLSLLQTKVMQKISEWMELTLLKIAITSSREDKAL